MLNIGQYTLQNTSSPSINFPSMESAPPVSKTDSASSIEEYMDKLKSDLGSAPKAPSTANSIPKAPEPYKKYVFTDGILRGDPYYNYNTEKARREYEEWAESTRYQRERNALASAGLNPLSQTSNVSSSPLSAKESSGSSIGMLLKLFALLFGLGRLK